jgi:hypothetical protein
MIFAFRMLCLLIREPSDTEHFLIRERLDHWHVFARTSAAEICCNAPDFQAPVDCVALAGSGVPLIQR